MKGKLYTIREIEKAEITKAELASLIGLKDECFDYALPQAWLNNFVRISGLSYNLVRSTCFSFYPKGEFGMVIVTGCAEVQKWLG